MFKIAVYVVHAIILILATFIGFAGVYNISSPDPERTYEVWFTAIAIFDVLVILSTYAQLRVKKVWLFVVTIVLLLVLFYFLPHLVLYIEDFLK